MILTHEQSEQVDHTVEEVITLVLDDQNVTLDTHDEFTVSVETRMRIRGVLVDLLEEGEEEASREP